MHVQEHVTTMAQGMSDSERLCEQLCFLFVHSPGGTDAPAAASEAGAGRKAMVTRRINVFMGRWRVPGPPLPVLGVPKPKFVRRVCSLRLAVRMPPARSCDANGKTPHRHLVSNCRGRRPWAPRPPKKATTTGAPPDALARHVRYRRGEACGPPCTHRGRRVCSEHRACATWR